MLSGKKRSFLKSAANGLTPVAFVGKNGLTPDVAAAVDEALTRRELIKISVQNNCEAAPELIAEALAGRTRSEVVQVIGKKIVLYRRNKTKPVIELPKACL